MLRTILLALALVLGAAASGGAAGSHVDPNGATCNVGGSIDPDGLKAGDAGNNLDPNGATSNVGNSIDPNG